MNLKEYVGYFLDIDEALLFLKAMFYTGLGISLAVIILEFKLVDTNFLSTLGGSLILFPLAYGFANLIVTGDFIPKKSKRSENG